MAAYVSGCMMMMMVLQTRVCRCSQRARAHRIARVTLDIQPTVFGHRSTRALAVKHIDTTTTHTQSHTNTQTHIYTRAYTSSTGIIKIYIYTKTLTLRVWHSSARVSSELQNSKSHQKLKQNKKNTETKRSPAVARKINKKKYYNNIISREHWTGILLEPREFSFVFDKIVRELYMLQTKTKKTKTQTFTTKKKVKKMHYNPITIIIIDHSAECIRSNDRSSQHKHQDKVMISSPKKKI